MNWSIERAPAGKHETALIIRNEGIDHARNVRVSVEPEPVRMQATDDEVGDVDRGAIVRLVWMEAWTVASPRRVKVEWDGRFGRRKSWSSNL